MEKGRDFVFLQECFNNLRIWQRYSPNATPATQYEVINLWCHSRFSSHWRNDRTGLVIHKNGYFYLNTVNPVWCYIFTSLMRNGEHFVLLQIWFNNLQSYLDGWWERQQWSDLFCCLHDRKNCCAIYPGVCSFRWNVAVFHRAAFHTSIVMLWEKESRCTRICTLTSKTSTPLYIISSFLQWH